MRLRHLGVVACSAEGAALCYRELCHEGFRRFGPHRHPRVTLDAIALDEWLPAFDAGDDHGVATIMLRSVRTLAAAGAELALCPDNSAHRALPEVRAASPIPWLHIGEVVATAAVRNGARRVGVLGTRYTMTGPVYRDALRAVGVEAVLPAPDDQETIDRIIFDELLDGVVTRSSKAAAAAVIDRLARDGCDAVALACTELPLLIVPEDSPLPTLDSTRLLAHAALDAAVA